MAKTTICFEISKYVSISLSLQLHGPTIAENPELTEIAARLLQEHTAAWSNIQDLLNQCACLISYFKSAVI